MADQKISDLSEDTSPAVADYITTVKSGSNRKATIGNFFKSIAGLTADTTPTTDDLIATINDPGGTPAPKKVTIANLLTLQRIRQIVNTETGAVATGTTTIPRDDTIPQNTEGTEFITLAITPTSATNTLRIDVVLYFSASAAVTIIAALFQDSTANALAAAMTFDDFNIIFTHYMTAGTTSATTFKVRIGGNSASTITFNGVAAGRLFGGVMASSITITEFAA